MLLEDIEPCTLGATKEPRTLYSRRQQRTQNLVFQVQLENLEPCNPGASREPRTLYSRCYQRIQNFVLQVPGEPKTLYSRCSWKILCSSYAPIQRTQREVNCDYSKLIPTSTGCLNRNELLPAKYCIFKHNESFVLFHLCKLNC